MSQTYHELLTNVADFLEPAYAPGTQGSVLANQLRIMLQKMNEGSVKILVKRDYWVFWRNGGMDTGNGYSESDMFTRMGYGHGAMHALDFITPTPQKLDAIHNRITLPSSTLHDADLFAHYKAHSYMALDDMRRENNQEGINDALYGIQMNFESIEQLYPRREFTNLYEKLYRELLLKYSKIPTGFPALDAALEARGGLRKDELVTFVGHTDGTKSKTPILDKLTAAMQHVPKDFLP